MKVEQGENYTGIFHPESPEDLYEWAEETSFISDEELEECRDVIESSDIIKSLTVKFEVPADVWTHMSNEEPEDVADVLERVANDDGKPDEPLVA